VELRLAVGDSSIMMGERDAAQAAVLIQALTDVRDKMIVRVLWLEKHDSPLDAASLRRDINEAQAHIAGLQRRYLGGETAASQHAQQVRSAR
jgi:hypothetical protein